MISAACLCFSRTGQDQLPPRGTLGCCRSGCYSLPHQTSFKDWIYRPVKPQMKERQRIATRRGTVTNLGLALTAYQQKYDIANGHMAKEIGITGSMLSRIKGGTMPDGNGLAKIMLWLSKVRNFPPYALVHHGQAVVGEGLILHRAPLRKGRR